jgi:hypothetical protein
MAVGGRASRLAADARYQRSLHGETGVIAIAVGVVLLAATGFVACYIPARWMDFSKFPSRLLNPLMNF